MAKIDVKTETTGKTPAETSGKTSLEPFYSLRSNIDRMFDEVMSGRSLWPTRTLFDWEPFRELPKKGGMIVPSVDVSETDDMVEIIAELPGLDEKNVEVVLRDDVLTVKGEKKAEKEEKEKDYYMMERRYGSFSRSFRLPESVEFDKIDADFSKGVLKITCPKLPETKPEAKKIEVKGD